jgi:S1-C subfamily serine protease
MADIERANGHRPQGLLHVLHPALMSAPRPKPEELDFDLDEALGAVLGLRAKVPEEAFTSSFLGTDRQGSAVLIDDDGLALTIGYLISEAESVTLTTVGGKSVQAHPVAYDYESGFGLVRAIQPLGVKPMAFGSSAEVAERDTVIVGSAGGRPYAISVRVVSKREFAGYWEYLLDEAIFTSPPHPAWSGAALIGKGGRLIGIGSLIVEEARKGQRPAPGNMFVPIDLLKPIMSDMLARGPQGRSGRPWVGMYTAEAGGKLVITGVFSGGPADQAGVEAGDVIVALNGEDLESVADFYRKIWASGPPGVEITLSVNREGQDMHLAIRTSDRRRLMRAPKSH